MIGTPGIPSTGIGRLYGGSMKDKHYLALIAAARNRRDFIIGQWLQAYHLEMSDNMQFWSTAMEELNDAHYSLEVMYVSSPVEIE